MKRASVLLLLFALVLLTACGGKKKVQARIPAPPPPISTTDETLPEPPAKVDNDSGKGEIEGEDAYKDAPVLSTQTGMASWYGPPYHNRKAANGEVFDMNALTAAHRTLPLNTIVRVTNLKTSHSAVLRITDRGPFVPDRIIDLSKAAAIKLDVWRPGTAKVRIDVLETPKSLEDGGRWCVQIGAIKEQETAIELKEKLMRRYTTAKVLQFASPIGDYWIRIRVAGDDKQKAEQLAEENTTPEGNIFLVRLD
ncbi:MAG TPA: septal ring lytic transglycosylase RlpA family protein [Terriglobales bacterium]|nr:septal ring lytic transglycosylase RlpA family protein [Terriglobales bacterium]